MDCVQFPYAEHSGYGCVNNSMLQFVFNWLLQQICVYREEALNCVSPITIALFSLRYKTDDIAICRHDCSVSYRIVCAHNSLFDCTDRCKFYVCSKTKWD